MYHFSSILDSYSELTWPSIVVCSRPYDHAEAQTSAAVMTGSARMPSLSATFTVKSEPPMRKRVLNPLTHILITLSPRSNVRSSNAICSVCQNDRLNERAGALGESPSLGMIF